MPADIVKRSTIRLSPPGNGRSPRLRLTPGPKWSMAAKSEPLWYPYTPRRRKLLNRLYRALNARGLRNRLGIGKRSS